MYLITFICDSVGYILFQNWPSYLKAVKRPTVSTTRMFLTMTGTVMAMMTMMKMTMLRTLVAPASNSGLEAKRSSQIKRNGVAFSNLTPFLN